MGLRLYDEDGWVVPRMYWIPFSFELQVRTIISQQFQLGLRFFFTSRSPVSICGKVPHGFICLTDTQGRDWKVVVPAFVDRMHELALTALQALKVRFLVSFGRVLSVGLLVYPSLVVILL